MEGQWHILNFIPSPGVRRSRLPEIIDKFNRCLSDPLSLFAPTFVAVTTEEGHVRKTEKPLLYHYIFLRGNENDIKRLCHTYEGFSFVMDHTGTHRHLVIDDETMRQFMIIARYYGNKLPCFPLEGINLEEGDRVQIVTGPCAGLTGTYLSRKGGKTGNILISVDSDLAAIVYDVKADYVRVLEFAHNSRRIYDQIDAFTLKLLTLTPGKEPPGAATADDRIVPAAIVFARRLGEVKVGNPKLDAKLQILLFAAYRLLGDTPNVDRALKKYRSLEHHITNPWTRALAQWILGEEISPSPCASEHTPSPCGEGRGGASKLQQALLKKLQ